MQILALEPYYGGSHRNFLDGWIRHSRHDWTVLGLPAYKWKWRMQHSPIHFAEQCRTSAIAGQKWDAIFCSDMLNLAAFRGLAPPEIAKLPTVVYFHENQLTYPVQNETENNTHYAFINLTTALAADAVWFNSGYHRSEWLAALPEFLKRMPDFQPLTAVDDLRKKSIVAYPGIAKFAKPNPGNGNSPLHILWNARWEFDKNPDDFFKALALLKKRAVPFKLSVVGESFRNKPPVFAKAKKEFAENIITWGYRKSREEYDSVLADADIVVSTAIHEFFGLAVLEAAAAGAIPLLPRRLAYPEVMGLPENPEMAALFYSGEPREIADKLEKFAADKAESRLCPFEPDIISARMSRFFWPERAGEMDQSILAISCDKR